MSRGIFRLKQVYEEQLSGTWSTRGDVWLSPSPIAKTFSFGYYAGGKHPAAASPSLEDAAQTMIDRIDYSNDTATASPKGGLNTKRNNHTSVGNSLYLYTGGGGYGSPTTSSVERTDYSNDSALAVVKGPLSSTRYFLASVGNADFGYFAGGYPGPLSTVDRIDYSNDTPTAVVKGPLSSARYGAAGVSNTNFGYFAGTRFPAKSIVDRIDYSNDTATSSPKGPLASSGGYRAGTGNANFGYLYGAYINNYSSVERIDYSNDTATAIVVTTHPSTGKKDRAGAAGNDSSGYFAGGTPGPGPVSTVLRIDYSNDTANLSPKGPLSAARYGLSGGSAQKNGLPQTSIIPASTVRTGEIAPQGTDFGYFAGGYPGPLSSVDRVDYSNDTATAVARGPLTQVSYTASGTGNASFGYFGARRTASSNFTSYVDRIDYSNDTATASPRGPMTAGRYKTAATGNTSFGYFGGGDTSPGDPGTVSSVDRIDYSNDTATASAKGPLSLARQQLTATGTQSFGYFSGGISYSPTPVYGVTTIDRIDYSNDTATAAVKGPLDTGRWYTGATGNADFGYFGGGRSYDPSSGSTNYSAVSRIDYSNDTATASPKGPLSSTRYGLAATGNTSFGYFGGGYQPSSPYNLSRVDRIDYSNDTATASPKGPLSVARNVVGSVSSRENAIPLKGPGNLEVPVAFGNVANPLPDFGYFANGSPGPGTMTTVDRINYSNDTATAEYKSSTTAATYLSNGAASNNTHAYFMGGFTSNANISNVERMSFTNGSTMPVPKGPLVYSRRAHFGVSNLNFAYNGGGYGTAPNNAKIDRVNFSNDTSTSVEKGALSAGGNYMSASGNDNFGYAVGSNKTLVQRIDYSNDTATAPSVANLTYTKNHAAALGNANFGYFGGGNQNTTYLERIDYSSDTTTVVTSSLRSNATSYPGSTGSSSFGYVAGGSSGTSSVDRIDFSNDTASVSPKGPLSDGRNGMRAASPKEYGHAQVQTLLTGTYATPHFGYFTGGTPTGITIVDRVDYSNDTATASPKGPLSQARKDLAATSSSTHGYFGGGQGSPGIISTVDRIDYVNDTATAVAKGPLSHVVAYIAATGNSDFGYFGGGTPSTRSRVNRIDYSNDTATGIEKGPLSAARGYLSATGNQDFGYFAGGNVQQTVVDRIDYSNDTATAVAKAPLSVAKSALSATGNSNFGYFGGGYSGGYISSVDRIDYSNDTATASPKGPLSVSRWMLSATGDSSFGYFGGGSEPTAQSTVDRVDYSNDTATASPKGALSSARYALAAASARENSLPILGPSVVANTTVSVSTPPSGYIFGGSGDPSLSPAYNQPTQRIDFTNDTATALVKGSPAGGNLYYNFAVGNTNFAYVADAGNSAPAPIQRFNYENDTLALVIKGAMNTRLTNHTGGTTNTVGGYNAAATGNHDYGWINGGYKLYSVPAPSGYYTAFSSIDRIDYSNDTADTLRRSYTTNRFGTGSATGTNDYGYWIGGSTDMTSYSVTSTKVDRTDYSNDTTNAVAKGNLTTVHGYESDSIGNSSYSWVAGVNWGSTSVDRIDYSSDTSTASPRGKLSIAMYGQSTTGSQSYGYFCGGGPGPKSIVQRVDYSNDTATASPKGPLAYKNSSSSGASTTYNALPST